MNTASEKVEATHTIEDDELNAIWRTYRSTPADARPAALRERLILHYAPLVNTVVARMGLHPDGAIEWNDLINYGLLGLMDAIERFEPERGNTFSTFASLRIRGAVLDALRQMDPLGRLARQRVRQAKEAIQSLTVELGRAPSDQEVAQAIGVSAEQYQQVLQDANLIMLSLDQPLGSGTSGGGDQKLHLGDLLEDRDAMGTLEQVEEAELQQRLGEAIGSLSKREQILLSLYYYEDLTMREVADVMEISQTRVCQIHARAIMTLKALMAPSTIRSSDEAGAEPDRTTDEDAPRHQEEDAESPERPGLDRRRSTYRTRRQWAHAYTR